jgi:apolipoprotein N-acyltransferase
MTPLAHRVVLAWGWSRALIAFAAGAVGALAMPPFGALPALAVSLSVAVWLIDGAAAGPRRHAAWSAAAAGWCWGFGYFIAGLWWLGAAFLVEADQFAWALPFGVLGLPAVLASFPAVGFGLARLFWTGNSGRILALAAGLAASEWLRGHLFTGFPWNTLGMAVGQNLLLMQAASVVGLYGLTALAIAICAAPATLGTGSSTRQRVLAPGVALAGLVVLGLFGWLRVPAEASPTVSGVKLRIMQPNLPQDAKFNPRNRDDIMRRYLALSDRATSPQSSGVADVTHLIWPESAFPFLLHRDARALADIAALLPPGVTLITGAARAEEPLPGEDGLRFYNSVQAIADDGTILSTYDKAHLVPFGEYFPLVLDTVLRGLGLRQFVHVPGGFTPAASRRTFEVRGLPPAAATVCYEAIFPGEVAAGGARPSLILNVTNDAWFGNTPGPRQHLAQARLRAVEEGLPLVRAANTGISAVVDSYGRTLGLLPLGIEGVLDAPLPRPLAGTPYRDAGDLWFAGLIAGFAAAALLSRSSSWARNSRRSRLFQRGRELL